MANRVRSYSRRHRLLGRRHLKAVARILLILFLALQPGWAGSGKGGGSGSGGCSSGSSAPDPNQVAQEVADTYSSLATPDDTAAATLSENINGDAYIAGLLSGASNRHDVRLPGYSYFQGVIHAENHVTVAGQVRVVGGILGVSRTNATANLYNGAMVTSNAHAVLGAGSDLVNGPAGIKTRIKTLEEVPSP